MVRKIKWEGSEISVYVFKLFFFLLPPPFFLPREVKGEMRGEREKEREERIRFWAKEREKRENSSKTFAVCWKEKIVEGGTMAKFGVGSSSFISSQPTTVILTLPHFCSSRGGIEILLSLTLHSGIEMNCVDWLVSLFLFPPPSWKRNLILHVKRSDHGGVRFHHLWRIKATNLCANKKAT